ncbi:MAG TPA: phosphoribosyl-AMP cyclohydrolase [Acidimicrobiales bacterium]|nr:phosphoribosyl-AMP cyclohydrolase [Acidimicrobiales bacterium]
MSHRPAALPPGVEIRFDADGLVPAVAQDDDTGQVLMLAWMNEATLAETLATGRMVYWSRSRRERWAKGDTSGDVQTVVSASYDCDADALLFRVRQAGRGACHTGEFTCFHRSLGPVAGAPPE